MKRRKEDFKMEKVIERRHFKIKPLYVVTLCFILCCPHALALWWASCVQGNGLVYKMTGEITAIEPSDKTIVVEVPMQGGKVFTVGGALATNAIVRKGDHSATLADFSQGEEVTVEWKSIETGHLILMLIK